MKYNYEYKIKGKDYFLNNLRGFSVKYLSPTNNLGSRVKITDTRHKKSVVLGYDYSIGDITKQAIKFLEDKEISINGMTNNETTQEMKLLSLDFSTQIKD